MVNFELREAVLSEKEKKNWKQPEHFRSRTMKIRRNWMKRWNRRSVRLAEKSRTAESR